jgi:hypothetical protein
MANNNLKLSNAGIGKLTLSGQEKVTAAAKEVAVNKAKLLTTSPVEVFKEDTDPSRTQ